MRTKFLNNSPDEMVDFPSNLSDDNDKLSSQYPLNSNSSNDLPPSLTLKELNGQQTSF